MDEVVNYLPSPCDRPSFKGTTKTGNNQTRDESLRTFFSLVFKTIVDPFIGKLSFKVMSGELEWYHCLQR